MKLQPIQYKKFKIKGNILAAPLAGYSNYPTRLIFQEQGADLTMTEMVSADGIVYRDTKTLSLLFTEKREKSKAVQIFGSDKIILKEAIEFIRDNTDYQIVNLNLGCPVKKVLKAKRGGYLLKEEEKLTRIFKTVGLIKGVVITIKIRSGWDLNNINFKSIGLRAQENNIQMVILHPRTVVQGFQGKANWDDVKELKKSLSIPVIGNGDITTPEEAKERMVQSGADGIMLGRGTIGNPWIFGQIKSYLRFQKYRTIEPEEKIRGMLEHLKRMIGFLGEYKGIINFRKQMFHYIKNFKGSAQLRKKLQNSIIYEDIGKTCNDFLN